MVMDASSGSEWEGDGILFATKVSLIDQGGLGSMQAGHEKIGY